MKSKTEKKSRKSKNGGTFPLAPVVATGALYAAAVYSKNTRKMKGGEDVVSTTPGGAVPVIVGSAVQSPLVTGNQVFKNDYMGGVNASRPAPITASGSLLEGGGKKKKARKQKGGDCHPMDAQVPTNAGSGGDIRASPVVSGAVGGVAAQATPALVGGAKKRKSKKKGGADCEPSPAPPAAPATSELMGGAKKRKSKKKGGADCETAPAVGGVAAPATPELMGGAKKRKTRKSKKRGGADGDDMGDDMNASGDNMNASGDDMNISSGEENSPVPPVPETGGDVSQDGGAKKRKTRKSKKRGGADEDDVTGGNQTAEYMVANMAGGAKKRKSKKRGGADPEAFDASADNTASAMGGFNSLLANIQKQVGGKKKKNGGAFKLYANELASLSKKLKKLV